jgi:alpha-tubulin suppressor-like RCC1 family protein
MLPHAHRLTRLAIGSLAWSFACSERVVVPGSDAPAQKPEATTIEQVHERAPITPVTAIAVGHTHSCAILEDGRVRCWGDGNRGMLGYGSTENIGDDELPSSAGDVALGGPAVQLALGRFSSCAVLEGGQLRCWGEGNTGALGLGNTDEIGDDERPIDVPPIDLGAPVLRVAVGGYQTCAVLEGGAVRCWGGADHGELGTTEGSEWTGDDELPTYLPPVALGGPALDVACSERSSCALMSDGGVRCWGWRVRERIGHPLTRRSQCMDCWDETDQTTECCMGFASEPADEPPLPLGEAALALVGRSSTFCAMLAEGRARCWGRDRVLGYPAHYSVPWDPEPLPHTPQAVGDVDWGMRLVSVAVGEAMICGLGVSGEVRCWGSDSHLWPLGVEPPINQPPSQWPIIDLGAPARQIAVGGGHACALLEGGTVRCWGKAILGQLGYGDRHVIGDDETPAQAGDVDVAGIVTPRASAVTTPDVLNALASRGVEITQLERAHGRSRFAAKLRSDRDLEQVVALLEQVQDLVGLDVSGIGLDDLTAIGRLSRLESLDISRNPVASIEPLERMVSLQRLYMSETNIEDINNLYWYRLYDLREIDISGTRVRHVQPHPNLQRVTAIGMDKYHLGKLWQEQPNLEIITELDECDDGVRAFGECPATP